MSKADDRRYQTLLKVLDSICQEAPKAASVYHAKDQQGRIQARSRAFIHLYLKARFGMTNFAEREALVTDGANDGGVDAYYIDKKQKKVLLIQSKFRATAANFVAHNLSADDLVKMDIKRILEGEGKAENKTKYNPAISKFQGALRKIPDRGSYSHYVTILGNSKQFTEQQMKKLIGNFHIDQYDHLRAYKDLLFPVVNGSYYSDPDLIIEIQRRGTNSDSHLDYDVVVSGVSVNVKLLYVPTEEIGRVMHTYKNSILSYNPRSFLEVSKNQVNREIVSSLRSDRANEFSLFNNGVTIVSDETSLSTNTGKKGLTQLVIKSPQLINGAQTAYSLSLSYSGGRLSDFKNKEVLLRVITFRGSNRSNGAQRDKLISRISRASNFQTRVDEADRRSNDPLQIKLQSVFFEKYGLYYERKRGEFVEGLLDGYIDKSLIVNRERLMRVALASSGQASQARSSVAKFFRKDEMEKVLKATDVDRYALGYEALAALKKRLARSMDAKKRYRVMEFGQALRYGTYAVVGVCVSRYMKLAGPGVDAPLDKVLEQWKTFEKWVVSRPHNQQYVKQGALDGVNYYKGQTLNDDLKRFKFKS